VSANVARAAAFFDLDRTLLRRSSALALAGPFRRRGLISRRQLVKAARALHADAKADAVRELAQTEGFDLDASWAYSDSHTDLPFLEAVGHPMVVNPDRRLRRIAAERGWPVLRFRERIPLAA
jgi:phosphoserine phosphatase